MFEFLALITKNHYWKFHSIVIKFILKIYGVKVGKDFYCEGIVKFRVRGKYSNIEIGNNVKFYGVIHIMNRHDAKIIIADDVIIENGFEVAIARDAKLILGKGCYVAHNFMANGGKDIIIGEYCQFAKNVSINASDHGMKRDCLMIEQEYSNSPIIIEDDVWIGTNVCINKGVVLRKGSIVGANAVVTKDTEEYSINAGVPSRKISERV
jgi:acetyltransferase-like isoleucine patch superfamily enzyme